MRVERFTIAVALLALTGCSDAGVAPHEIPTAQTPAATSTPDDDVTPDAATGEPFSLTTHCGISTAWFAGRDWVAVTPLPAPRIRDDVTGVVVADGSTAGTMTVVDDDLVRFTVTDPAVEDVGLTVDFVPAAAPPTSFCE